MIHTQKCKKCGNYFDYQECPYCRKKEEEKEDEQKTII